MAIRSCIGMVRESDGKIVSVYCHSDGYPDHVGRLLFEVYNTPEKISELLSHGEISCLHETIGEKHDFDSHLPGVCRFYHRDRGEELEIEEHKTQKDFLEYAGGCAYAYLFKGGKWHYTSLGAYAYLLKGGKFCYSSLDNKVSRLKVLTAKVCGRT